MEQYELPDGWVWAKITELADIIMGQSPPSSTYNDEGIGLPFYQGKADFGEINPTPRKWCGAPGKIAEAGDILMSVRAPVGPTNLADTECCIGRGLSAIRPLGGIPSHFVFHYLRFIEQDIADMGQGSTFAAISRSDVESIDIPLAPLPEQLRIAEKIEALFEQSRTAREALDAIPALLRQFRQSVLAAAFRGNLSTRDPNDEPASVLLERILAERRRRWEDDLRAKGKDPRRYTYPEPIPPDTSDLPELPEGWCWATVEQLGAIHEQAVLTGPFGSNLGQDDYVDTGVPVLTIGCLTEQGVVLDKAFYVSEEKAVELDRYRVKRDDILFSRMASVGRADTVPEGIEGAIINYHLMRLRLNGQVIDPRFFIFYVRGSATVADYIREINHGITRDGINTQQLLHLPVVLAPKAEQRQIVARVRSLLDQADVIQVAAELARRRLDRLDQSILARAFRGELVPQDPDDEPASVLLERIRAGRAQGTETRLAKRARQRRNRQ